MDGNATYFTPAAVISPTDHGGALLIVDIVGLIVAIASVCVRIHLSRRAGACNFFALKDDVLCYIATILVIVESSLVWAATRAGSGKTIGLLSPSAIIKVQQFQYAIDILYILALFCARASILFLLERLQKSTTNRIWRSAIAVLGAWVIASLLMIALKCNLRHPWIQYNAQCTGLLARWYVVEVVGAVVDASLIVAVLYLVYNVQMPRIQKAKVLLLFGIRVFVILFAILRILHLPEYLHSADPTFTGIPAAIFAQAQLHASLVTCTTPLLKALILEFNTLGHNRASKAFSRSRSTA